MKTNLRGPPRSSNLPSSPLFSPAVFVDSVVLLLDSLALSSGLFSDAIIGVTRLIFGYVPSTSDKGCFLVPKHILMIVLDVLDVIDF
jgi:hypothetical protein